HAGATVLLRDRRAEQAEAGDFRDQLGGKARLVEGVADDRQNLLVDEATDGVLHHALLVGEQRADVVQVERVQAGGSHGRSIEGQETPDSTRPTPCRSWRSAAGAPCDHAGYSPPT